MRAIALTLALTFPLYAQAQGRVDAIIDKARAECAAIGGTLTVEEAAYTEEDLDGDREVDDMVIDFDYLSCSADLSLWGGTAGTPRHFVVDDTYSASWRGGTWTVMRFDAYTPAVILIGRHGDVCGGYGAQPCVQAVIFDGGEFMTPRYPQSNENFEAEEAKAKR